MRALILALATTLAVPIAARADDATARWAEEARRFLVNCAAPPAGTSETACALSQAEFVADYIEAMRGGLTAQRNTGFMLTPGPGAPRRDERAFIRQDPVHGCAWRLVVVEAGDAQVAGMDAGNAKAACGHLSQAELAAARGRAGHIRQEQEIAGQATR